MSVKIRLKKFGAKARPYYRIVIMDSRLPRDSKTIDEIGLYHPIEAEDKQIRIDEAKAKFWLARGAQPSDTVRALLNKKSIQVK
ncbi:MAG: 30S ribosomal protein S16 [Spirochaetia bacterium]|nr:30S ribosomal protein S16 [Spirochaetia bacterium]